MPSLQSAIERLATLGEVERNPDARKTFLEFREQLTQGKIRAAEKISGEWKVNAWVKQGILLGFRLGELAKMGDADAVLRRQGHLSRPPVYRSRPGARGSRWIIGAGRSLCRAFRHLHAAHVHQRRGVCGRRHDGGFTCAGRVLRAGGKRVHLSAAAQIGGVLEPVNAAPVIIEDDVLVGGNCGVYEGTLVRARAVLGAERVLTRSTPVYDIVRGQVYKASAEKPLEVPENAVVVPGSRAVKKGYAAEWNLSLYTPVIVKYRDEKTDRGIELEEWFR